MNEEGERTLKEEKEELEGNRRVSRERITKRYERERIKIEKLLTLGYTTSGDP